MATQLRIIQIDKTTGKSASKTQEGTEALTYFMTFKQSITQTMASTMQDLSDCVFFSIWLTALCCDSYLDYLKAGVKYNTLAALRNSPLHMSSIFLDHVIAKAEGRDISPR